MSRKREILIHEGAVAVFDVLGYQELLLNNSIKDVVALATENLIKEKTKGSELHI